MEPENRALEVRQAFERVPTAMKLALIGDAPHAEEYIRRVRDTRDRGVVIPGAIYGLGYRELGSWCFAYIHATEVGGTHPALIEAMGRGNLVLYLETPENAEVCGDAGLPYRDEAGLAARIGQTLGMSEAERERYREKAADASRERYNWDNVTTQYETLLERPARIELAHTPVILKPPAATSKFRAPRSPQTTAPCAMPLRPARRSWASSRRTRMDTARWKWRSVLAPRAQRGWR